MIGWLIDTLVWTAVLIALVLVVRRAVARAFGPRIAYALWVLPALRLVLPPVTLPAWMAPPSPVASVEAAAPLTAQPAPVAAAAAAEASPFVTAELVLALALAVWLGGAAVVLFRRFRNYHLLRRNLLAGARVVGRAGNVRLIETPGTSAPVALGVRDKIVALPRGFMAQPDIAARNLALRHELAHHQGHDLLVNMLVQPLFALHWFNPLGPVGWVALRRDQEAACDARVIGASEPGERAAYANVIASFAAGPNVALAAAMACPVLGDKSIIHRLRSLKMNEFSARRRYAGIGLIAAAAIALPLTASVSYAEQTAAPQVPEPPQAPAAPDAPEAPPAPEAPFTREQSSEDGDAPEADRKVERRVIIIKDGDGEGETGATGEKKVRKMIFHGSDGGTLSQEDKDRIMAEVERGLAEADITIGKAHEAQRVAIARLGEAKGEQVRILMSCEDGDDVSEVDSKDGKKIVKICQSEIMASAVAGLREARQELEAEKDIPRDMLDRIIKALDEKIAKWENDQG